MKLGVPWGVKKIRPEARETAIEAARRSGVSLDEWLNSVILQQAEQQGIDPQAHGRNGEAGAELAGVNHRLDDLTRRIDQLMRSGPAAYAPPRSRIAAAAEQLAGAKRPPSARPNVPLPPGLDRALSEIGARRRALNGEPAEAAPPPPRQPEPIAPPAPVAAAPAPAPAPAPMQTPMPAQNLIGLEDQLRHITDQIETLRKPGIEEAISALRGELGEIGHALSEAMPRHAIETLERQIAGLSQRIEDGRQAGVDHQALAGIEHGLAEVRDALHGLTPAESLVGYNEAANQLAHKIDLIVAQNDPAAFRQLQNAVITLRDMANHVASDEAVNQLAAHVHELAVKIDHVAHAAQRGDAFNQLDQRISALADSLAARQQNGGDAFSRLEQRISALADSLAARQQNGGDAFSRLEQRISALADALATRQQNGGAVSPQMEALVQSLADKIDQIQDSRGDNVAIAHLEDRIVKLVEKLDQSESRLGQIEAIERGVGDLLVQIEDIRADKQASDLRADGQPAVDELKHDMARTQDALEAVHGTLGHLVDRLAMIEQGMRAAEPAPAPAAPAPEVATFPEEAPLPAVDTAALHAVGEVAPEPPPLLLTEPAPAPEQTQPIQPAPEPESAFEPPPLLLTEPAPAPEQAQPVEPAPEPEPAFEPPPLLLTEPVSAPGQAHPIEPAFEPEPAVEPPPLLLTEPAPPVQAPAVQAPPVKVQPRPKAATSLPLNPEPQPDLPLEPGSGRPKFNARVAVSESALGGAGPAVAPATGNKSNFIEAARRAARAALQQGQNAAPGAEPPPNQGAPKGSSLRNKVMKRMKSLLIAASIIAIVVGAFQVAGNFINFRDEIQGKADTGKADTAKTDSGKVATSAPGAAQPSRNLGGDHAMVPTVGVPAATGTLGATPSLFEPPALGTPKTSGKGDTKTETKNDITGSIPQSASGTGVGAGAGADLEHLPAAIGSMRLREAALGGDAGAAYEVAARFAAGRGVTANLHEAALWFERAAQRGLAPAQFRYASMLEKGQGVKKDLAEARRFYLAAAEQGHAKAMHNLAVLYAEGVDGKPDYAAAVKWFRQAALHGVADSQYNLGVLAARGLGTEKSFAESYKWFALAAAQGDHESAKKRDDVASRLDAAALAAAQQAVKRFHAMPQPKKATAVPKPNGGWDNVAGQPAPTPTPKAKPQPPQRSHPSQAPLSLGSFTIGKR
jgi:localization factor PodJL